MKKILVPTDFSEQAEYALETAALIAKKHNAELFIVHMVELPVHLLSADKNELPEAIFFLKLAHKHFETFLDKPYLKDITVHEMVKEESITEGINKVVAENDINLIVMGSSGASGVSEIFVGSNTEKVVRMAEAPVMVIKKPLKEINFKHMVYACSFLHNYHDTFKRAVKMAKEFGYTLHLLYVNTPNNFKTTHTIKDRINSFLSLEEVSNYTVNIYNDETIEEGILNFANSISADLLSVSTHGRRGLAHFFNGSLSEDLVNHAIRPVITLKI
ncbi:universal stress protein [Neptunitalea lumnitzerae]|uniref:Universal stress protein UspA n=1 Tax=Neptunitalea lumnitzerae TaxID=2965509 RepID=A0ABQ5MMS9_9FLAO|nr:universal stress protein [Neptunitalea sp. Y10]GLB50699.1 universal stress protein UspA [Neptunitalea sp. Y10]